MNIKFIIAFSLAVAFCAPLPAQDATPNSMCPVMKGEHIKKKFHSTWQGREVYFCCKSCVKRFKKHPEKYTQNL